MLLVALTIFLPFISRSPPSCGVVSSTTFDIAPVERLEKLLPPFVLTLNVSSLSSNTNGAFAKLPRSISIPALPPPAVTPDPVSPWLYVTMLSEILLFVVSTLLVVPVTVIYQVVSSLSTVVPPLAAIVYTREYSFSLTHSSIILLYSLFIILLNSSKLIVSKF